MKKYNILSAFICLFISNCIFGQNTTILPSAIQVPNVATLGTCSALQKGQLVLLTSDNNTYYCNGTGWQQLLITASVANTTPWLTSGSNIYNSNVANVGIGLSNPNRGKLEVSGVSGIGNTNALFGSGSSGISLQQNWPTIGFNQYRDNTAGQGKYMSNGYAAIQYFDPNGGAMAFDFFTNGSANNLTPAGKRALTIHNNGNISIASANSNTTLHVPKNGNFDGSAIFSGTNYSSYFNHSNNEDTYLRPGKTTGKLILNDLPSAQIQLGNGNGNVGINVSPSDFYNLEISQGIYDGGIVLVSPDWASTNWEIKNGVYSDEDVTSCLTLKYNTAIKGWFRPHDGGYSAYSDRSLKSNIEDIGSVLDKVMNLKPSKYEVINNNPSNFKSLGFIAQEMIGIFPEVVDVIPTPSGASSPQTNAKIMGINYSQLSVIAIKAIQEQQVIIDDLKKEINLLKQMIKE